MDGIRGDSATFLLPETEPIFLTEMDVYFFSSYGIRGGGGESFGLPSSRQVSRRTAGRRRGL